MRHLLFSLLSLVFFSSCVSIPQTTPKNTSASWNVAEFSVSFQAGPHANTEEKHRSFSYYRIDRKLAQFAHQSSLVLESALSSNSFSSSKDKPSDYITIYASATGNSLLIQEIVPNDCAPCTNYLLVQVIDEDLIYHYLELPTIQHSETEYENAYVTAISDEDVTYRYSNGARGTRSFARSKSSENRVTFPG